MIKLLVSIVYCCLSYVYCKNALHMFQQNHYEAYRYFKWLFYKKNLHFSNVLIYFVLTILVSLLVKAKMLNIILNLTITIIFTLYVINLEAKKEYIKPLDVTNRVKRQIGVLLFVLVTSFLLIEKLTDYNFICLAIGGVYLPYLLIFVMDLISHPFEEAVKKHYENDARKMLRQMDNLKVVGITGSYGKTSTKNIVTGVIGESFYTLKTPASFNTPMGITKTIRESLKPIHEMFVCEISATRVGQVSYLMDFVKPSVGIVTSIGPQHLLTFKSLENIINEKMQMIEMLPNDGLGIVNGDNEYIANYKIKNNVKVLSVGIHNKSVDYLASDIKYSKDGSKFSVNIKGKKYKFETILLGEHNITNLLIAIALADQMGVKIKDIVKNVKGVRQVEHRLELKKINEYTFIDDAFNSNPVGSKMALEVLSMMPGKRVIVTPGLIDLGESENEYNYKFGTYMLDKADYVILVGEKQTAYIYNGLKDSGYNTNNILVVKSAKEALAYIYKNFSSKDTILLENDLPDAFSM